MGANLENKRLMEALERDETLKARGFTAACGPTGSVVFDRWNHVRGVWHFAGNHYFWTPAGYTEPTYRCSTLDPALQHTLEVLAKI